MTLSQEKLLTGIKYFVKKTKNVGRTKLFKLLYFWDFVHFKRYGLSVTGLDYFTYPFGPVPRKLYNAIDNNSLPEEFYKHFTIVEEKQEDDPYKQFRFILKNKSIDLELLTPNEIKVLEEISFIFKDATANEMTGITHLKNTPWEKTKQDKGEMQMIDYFLAIDDESTLDIETIKERFQFQKDLIADGRI